MSLIVPGEGEGEGGQNQKFLSNQDRANYLANVPCNNRLDKKFYLYFEKV